MPRRAYAKACWVGAFLVMSCGALLVLTRVLYAQLIGKRRRRRRSPFGGEVSTSPSTIGNDLARQEESIARLAMMITVSWWTFPLVWCMEGPLGWLDEARSNLAFVGIELVAKVLCTLVMMHGSIESLEEREARAKDLENWRLSEQLRAESMFVSYVFHEMRNPYNGIAGHLSCIDHALQGALRDRTARNWEACLKNMVDDVAAAQLCSQHMSDVLNNVLDLRRIEEGGMTMDSEVFDVCALVRDTTRMVCPKDSVCISRRVLDANGGDLASLNVVGDGVRLRQVLLNLLSNASKHTSRGRIEVLVRVVDEARQAVGDGVGTSGDVFLTLVSRERLFS